MISGDQIAGLAAVSGALVMAGRKLSGFGMSFEVKAWMALAWVLIIVALVLIGGALGLAPGRF